jgi:hypothetical protein
MNRAFAIAFAAALLATPGFAQPPAPQGSAAQAPSPASKTYDMRDDASPWINDPNVRAFYQATVEAFAHGPDHVDREAYLKRSREIFTALAAAHGMPTEQLLDHVKAIPDEVIVWATRDPHTLDSYDNFVVALFGPQKSGPGSPP